MDSQGNWFAVGEREWEVRDEKNLMEMTSTESIILWKKEQDRLNEALDIAYEALWTASLAWMVAAGKLDDVGANHDAIIENACVKCVEAAEIILDMKTTEPFRRVKRKLRIEWK